MGGLCLLCGGGLLSGGLLQVLGGLDGRLLRKQVLLRSLDGLQGGGGGLDVDLIAGELGGQAGVLALLADGQGELVVGHDDPAALAVGEEVHADHVGGGQRGGHIGGGVVAVLDDVHLFPVELLDDVAHPLAAGADAAVLDVLNDLKDVTPAATNARISATHSPENGAEKTEKSERELHYDVKYPYDLSHEEVSDTDKALAAAMEAIADGPSIAVLKTILANQDVLELVGAHSHIGSNIHDADAFIHAAKRMMLLRKTLWATDAYILPEIDLGGGYSVAYTDGEDSMDIDVELTRLADAVNSTNRALGMPAPAISFEPGRYIVAPAGVTLYRVGTIKHVHLSDAKDSDGNPIAERVYVSVDGGMSDNIRPALYGADYTARLANRTGSAETMLARVCGMHCESGDIVVHEVQLPADLKRGDILAVPVTGAYGRTMASNYNQALIPAVVAVSESGAHVMLRRQTVDDLLNLDVSE